MFSIHSTTVAIYGHLSTRHNSIVLLDFSEVPSNSKIIIGKGRVSLADLLLRSSGFMGPFWLPVFSPMDTDSGIGGCRLNWPSKKNFDYLYTIDKRKAVGAVEIRLGFLDKSDRKNIIQLAMDAGYVIPWTNRLETEDMVWQQMGILNCSYYVYYRSFLGYYLTR